MIKTYQSAEITYSEIITIIVLYQQSRYENFKSFYQYYLKLLHKSDFPTLLSYDRFGALKPRVLWYLATLLQWLCERAKETSISYIDSTPIEIESESQKTKFLPELQHQEHLRLVFWFQITYGNQ